MTTTTKTPSQTIRRACVQCPGTAIGDARENPHRLCPDCTTKVSLTGRFGYQTWKQARRVRAERELLHNFGLDGEL